MKHRAVYLQRLSSLFDVLLTRQLISFRDCFHRHITQRFHQQNVGGNHQSEGLHVSRCGKRRSCQTILYGCWQSFDDRLENATGVPSLGLWRCDRHPQRRSVGGIISFPARRKAGEAQGRRRGRCCYLPRCRNIAINLNHNATEKNICFAKCNVTTLKN